MDVKQKLPVNITDFAECRKKYENLVDLNETQMCAAQANNAGTCSGDSGSPLMSIVGLDGRSHIKRFKIEGILSLGLQIEWCARGRWPAVFTRVASYERWIKDNISKP